MIKKCLFAISVCLLLGINICMAQAEHNGYIVKFKQSEVSMFGEGVSLADCDENFEEVVPEWNMYTTDDMQNAQEYVEAGIVEYIEPDYTLELFGSYTFTPGDLSYDKQDNIALVNTSGAWDMGVFGEEVIVGVIDSGITYHDDLIGNIAGGYNFLASSEDETSDITDNAGHGTFCSSIIAAEANYFGIIGVAPKAKIITLKCFDANEGNTSAVAKAIKAAVDTYNCDIINMSFGNPNNSSTLKSAIDYASSKGAILIAAAGNKASTKVMYPGGYSNVINVGSVGMTNEEKTNVDETQVDVYKGLSSFSNYGTALTVVAPGASAEGYNNTAISAIHKDGTSFSAPIVSGIAALCKSVKPDLTHEEFEQLIIETCEDLGDEGKDIYFGYGLVDAQAAVEKLVKQHDVYISPLTIINENAFQIITNNTQDNIQYADIWLNGDNVYASQPDIAPGISMYSGIAALQTDKPIHYIWESFKTLKPLYKYQIENP